MEGAFIGVEREGNKDKWMVASSPYYASDDDPPVIIFHGTSDNVVNIEQSQELYDSLKHHNVVTEFVKVSGGSHGGDKMNSTENLNKAVAFLDKAREAKAAAKPADSVVVADTSKKDSAVVDTSKKDTTVRDTTVKDTSTGFVPRFEKSYDLEIHGNRLFALGAPETLRYTIIAVNGSRKFSGVFRKELDLSALPPGIYAIKVESPSGVMNIIRFVRK